MQLDLEDPAEFTASVLSEISMVKGEMMPLAHYYPKSCSEEVFKALYEGYEDQMRREKLLDFDDMLSMCYELFKARPDILTAWQKKYQYILIDEFQDINRVQYEIVKMLALPQNNLFIVGDDDQSIYRFRGARPELMLGFEKDYPEAERILLGYQLPLSQHDYGKRRKGYQDNNDPFSKGNLRAQRNRAAGGHSVCGGSGK